MRRDKIEIRRDVLSLVCALGVVALAFSIASCTQEPPLPYDGGQKEYMDFSLELTPPGAFTLADTRAIMSGAQQNAMNSAAVLVFDKGDILISHQKRIVTDMDGAGGVKKQVKVSLKISQSESDLYGIMVIGNPPDEFDFTTYVGKTKDDLKAAFNVSVSGKWVGNKFVMYGEAPPRRIELTNTHFEIEMLRSLARVDIGVGVYDEAGDKWAGLPDVFTLKEVRVVNSRDKYAVIPAAAALGESGKVTAPTIPKDAKVQGTTTAVRYVGTPDITDNSTKSAIFLAEAPKDTDDKVTLLVGGSYKRGNTTYYRIDMCVPKAGASGSYEYLPILRNHLYRISITGVSGAGFASPQEALLAAPINITTELTPIEEGDMGDIVFDGNNYIQTDASSVLIYGAPDGAKTYTIATVKANFAAGVAATVTVKGLGSTSTINLTSDEATPISVAIPARTTTGSYTIKVGRLTKVIPVSIQPPVDAHFDFLPFQNVSSISIENPELCPWLTLSHRTVYVNSEQQSSYIAGSSAGKACFHFHENIATTGAPRMASASVQRKDNSGTTRVIFEQRNLEGMVMGYFGGAKDKYGYTKLLAVESVEEYNQRVYDDTSIGTINREMEWGFYKVATYVVDKELGQSGTITLARRTDSGIAGPYTIYNNYAARYCYDKNRDINGNGGIDKDEVVWYLPAQNQLMGAWIVQNGMTAPFTAVYYWSATEYSIYSSWRVYFNGSSTNYGKPYSCRVRCVREI